MDDLKEEYYLLRISESGRLLAKAQRTIHRQRIALREVKKKADVYQYSAQQIAQALAQTAEHARVNSVLLEELSKYRSIEDLA